MLEFFDVGIREEQVAEFLSAAHEVGRRGLTRCSSGNLSRRVGDWVLVSGTGSWLPELKREQVSLCRLDNGEFVNGVKPSMESTFHLTLMRNRPEVQVVLHCQSRYATAVACMKKKPVDFNVTAEIPVHCGQYIPVIPYFRPGSPELAGAVCEALQEHNSLLMEKHGQVFVGKDFQQVIERAEFLEMACEIILLSGMDYNTLSEKEISDLEHYILGKVK